jgi:hypothetical protein
MVFSPGDRLDVAVLDATGAQEMRNQWSDSSIRIPSRPVLLRMLESENH